MKSGNLNFLEPCGPLQACNGTALPFYLIYIYIYIYDLPFRNAQDTSLSNGKIIAEVEVGRSGCGLFLVLSRHLPVETEENHRNPLSAEI
jgi:hypothetical protein